MSSIYVKLFTGFYDHRKTARLRARIGDDALEALEVCCGIREGATLKTDSVQPQ